MSNTLPASAYSIEDNYGMTDVFQIETQPGHTYKLHMENETFGGYVDELEAYKQAIYLILNTERYKYLIYSWNYGVELEELFGQPIPYVVPELERRITDAVMQDDRTKSVSDFQFDISNYGEVSVTFKATSVYGETEITKTVRIA